MLSSTVRAADVNALAITAPGTNKEPFALCAGVSRLLILVEKKGFFFGAPVSVLEMTEQEGIVLVKVEKPEQGARIQRRRHLRTGVGNIIRSVKSAGSGTGDSLASLKFTARDLSAGGMSVFSPGAVPEGTVLELDLNLGRTKISVHAEVMRSRKTEGGFDASLKFTGLSEQDHNAISCFVLSRKFERNNSHN